MNFTVVTQKGTESLELAVDKLLVIGFAGRNVEKTMEHIKELEEEGIKCPKRVPVVYRCSKEILTTADTIEVVGHKTSGELEFLAIIKDGKTYIGLGSDHTDRELEAVSIHKSKQLCLKPIALTLWDYDEIKDHFEDIKMIAYQKIDGKEVSYQNGRTADLLPIQKIIDEAKTDVGSVNNCILYTGTVPLIDGFKYGEEFACKLVDEKLKREIVLSYKIDVINEQ
jgi:hypothetical protein